MGSECGKKERICYCDKKDRIKEIVEKLELPLHVSMVEHIGMQRISRMWKP